MVVMTSIETIIAEFGVKAGLAIHLPTASSLAPALDEAVHSQVLTKLP